MEKKWLFFSELKSVNVFDARQDKAGAFDDAVVDIQTGKIALFIAGSGGFLGMGTHKTALPAAALHFEQGEGRLGVNENSFENAPGTNDNWPQKIDSDFIDGVYRHFGYKNFTGR